MEGILAVLAAVLIVDVGKYTPLSTVTMCSHTLDIKLSVNIHRQTNNV